MSEQAKARQEACCNASETEYFGARPQIDTLMQRHNFCAGFYRGYAAALAAAPAQERIDALELEVRQLTEQIAGLRHALTPQADSVLEDAAPSQAARDVLAERQRQISVEGWTPEHDDEHECGDMARAAACYLLVAAGYPYDDVAILRFWPWIDAWKPTDQRRNLVKAGALILAEIERIDRAARKQGANHD